MTPQVTRSLAELPGADRPRAVTIGKFDGVHRGHQAVIARLREVARGADIKMVKRNDRHQHPTT